VITIIALVVALAAAITVILVAARGPDLFGRWFAWPGQGARPVVAFEESTRNVAAGAVFSIPWRQEHIDEPGTFVLSYPCSREGLAVTFSDGSIIPCGTHVPVSDESPIELVATSEAEGTVPLTLSVGFIPEGESDPVAASTAVIAVEPDDRMPPASPPPVAANPPPAAQNPPPAAGTPSTSTYRFPTDSAPAATGGAFDLAVRIVDIGIADPATGTFLRSGPAKQGEHAAVMFEVENVGGSASQPWHFTADLPTAASYQFVSQVQQALRPAEKIRFTLGFDGIRSGTSTGLIAIDPQSATDADSANNATVATFVRTD